MVWSVGFQASNGKCKINYANAGTETGHLVHIGKHSNVGTFGGTECQLDTATDRSNLYGSNLDRLSVRCVSQDGNQGESDNLGCVNCGQTYLSSCYWASGQSTGVDFSTADAICSNS